MKKTGKAVTIMQRSTDATWEYYTMNVLIKNDVLTSLVSAQKTTIMK